MGNADEECVDEAVQLAARVINQCNRLPAGRSRRRLIQDATDELCTAVERSILAAREVARQRAKSAVDATQGGPRVKKRLRRTVTSDSSESDASDEDPVTPNRNFNRETKGSNQGGTPMSLVDSSSSDESIESLPRKRLRSQTRKQRHQQSPAPSSPNMVRTRSRAASMPETKYSSDPEQPQRSTRRSSRLASVAAAKFAIEQRDENEDDEADEYIDGQSVTDNENNSEIDSETDSDVEMVLALPVVRPRLPVKPNPLISDRLAKTPSYSTDDEDTDEEANLKRRRARNNRILAENQTERLRPLLEEIENSSIEISEPETVSDKNDSDWYPNSVSVSGTRQQALQNRPVNTANALPSYYATAAPQSYPQPGPLIYQQSRVTTQPPPIPSYPSALNSTSVRYMSHNVGANNQVVLPQSSRGTHPNNIPNLVRQYQQTNGITPRRTAIPQNGLLPTTSALMAARNSNPIQPANNYHAQQPPVSFAHLQAQRHQVQSGLPVSSSTKHAMPRNGLPSPQVTRQVPEDPNQVAPLAYVQTQQAIQYQAEMTKCHQRIESLRLAQMQARQRAEAHAAQAMDANAKADEGSRKILALETELRKRIDVYRQEVTRAKSLANAHLVANKKSVIEANHFTQIHNQVIQQYLELQRKYKLDQQRMNEMIVAQQKRAMKASALAQIERQNSDAAAVEKVLNSSVVAASANQGGQEKQLEKQIENDLEKILQPKQKQNSPDLSEATLRRYKSGVDEVGIRLVTTTPSSPLAFQDAANNFKQDHVRYMSSINVRLPPRLLNNLPLDMFKFYKAVLQFGGIQNVVWRNFFEQVSHILGVPTSQNVATFLLDAYVNDIYAYEQKHIWGRGPNEMPTLCVPEGSPMKKPSARLIVNQTAQAKANGNGGASKESMAKGTSMVKANVPNAQVVNPIASTNAVSHVESNRPSTSEGTT